MAIVVNGLATRCPDDLGPLSATFGKRYATIVARVDDPECFDRELRRVAEHADMIVIASGDGTISRAALTLIELGRPVGLLPFGNANDLARGLGMPLDIDGACQALLDPAERRIDVGLVNGHAFLSAATLGIGAIVSKGMAPSMKRRWGRLSQLGNLIRAIRSRRPFALVITAEGVARRLRSVHVAVANGRTHGGGIAVAADGRLDDGLLDVSSVRPRPLSRLLSIAPWFVRGERSNLDAVDQLRLGRCHITTSRTLDIAADGDVVTATPADFSVLASALTVLVPRQPEDSQALEGAVLPAGAHGASS